MTRRDFYIFAVIRNFLSAKLRREFIFGYWFAKMKTETMNKCLINKLSCLAFIILCLPFISNAQSAGTIRGTVTSDVNSSPLAGVSIQITQLKRSTETNEKGEYEFANVPDGNYTLVTHIEGFSDKAQNVRVASGAGTLNFRLSITALREEVNITASGSEESIYDSFQTVNSVGSVRLKEQASTAIGEVLEREAGVGKRSFGTGSSRPVIRGFDGDRVLVLQDGIRNGSLGSQSGDHGEPVDTLNLERLEVIKGPATLLYGSNAIGGVINAVTGDEDDAHPGVRGYFSGLGATNNKQGGVSGGLEYGYKKWLFNFNGNTIREGDYNTPFGRIPNSASRSYGGLTSVGYFTEKGFVQGYFNVDRRRYGVPYAPLYESGELLSIANGGADCSVVPCQFNIFAIRDSFANGLPPTPDEQIDIRMRRNNYRVRGGFRNLTSPITQGTFYIDYSNYRHEEIETNSLGDDTVATNFFNNVFSYRGVFEQAKYKKWSGRFGFEGYRRNYLTEGAEQLVDGRVFQHNFSVFALEDFDFNRVAFQFGGRLESNHYRPTNAIYTDRTFTGFSGAAALRVRLWEGASFVTNFTSSYRAPALEELYNNGPHVGTVSFEVGNQNLKRERSNGVEFSLRQQLNRLRVNGSFFYYNISDFVYLAPQDADGDGEVDVNDNLPVADYLQNNSRYVGADLMVDFDINKYLSAYFNGDIVSAKLRDVDLYLPRITPARARVGLDFRYKGLSIRPEGIFAYRKDINSTYPLETPTAGYGLFNISGSYIYGTEKYAHIFTVSGYNVGDRLYRNHLSFIKDLAPEPGRGLRASYTIRFF